MVQPVFLVLPTLKMIGAKKKDLISMLCTLNFDGELNVFDLPTSQFHA